MLGVAVNWRIALVCLSAGLYAGPSFSFGTCTDEVLETASALSEAEVSTLFVGETIDSVRAKFGPPACDRGSGIVYDVWVVSGGKTLSVTYGKGKVLWAFFG